MNIDGYLFDFDGTLADTNQTVINSWQHTFKTVTDKEGDLDWIVSTFGEPLWDSMEKVFPKEKVDEYIEIYRSYQKEHFEEEVRLFDGMREVVLQLKSMGKKVAVVTSRLRPTTEQALRTFGLLNKLDAIVCGGETKWHKPHPAPILVALDRMGIKPSRAVMVGDSTFDIICANRAGVESVLVEWSIMDDGLFQTGEGVPNYRIKTPEEILKLGR